MKTTKASVTAALKNKGRFMMLTHGEGYSLDDGRAVDRRLAEATIGDLFGDGAPVQRKHGPAIVANDDGLFPGCSQTWSAKDVH
jgi:hypothetical protein